MSSLDDSITSGFTSQMVEKVAGLLGVEPESGR